MQEISVIIPNYNHEAFLKERISSVLNQTYTNYEVIILDDCSTDGSRDIVEQYCHHPKISEVAYNFSNSSSPFKQWKKGIEMAKGEWIWIAESDDFSDPNFLKEVVETIAEQPTVSLFYCDSYWVENNRHDLRGKFSEYKNHFFEVTKWSNSYFLEGIKELNEFLKLYCTINNASSVVFKKSVALPFLDELQTYSHHGDWFFYIKMSQKSNIFYLNKPLNYFRNHDSSRLNSASSVVKSKEEHFRILSLLYSQENITEKEKLITVFSNYHLGFGLIEDGIKTSIKIIEAYLKTNKHLAIRVISHIFLIKILRKKIKERRF